MGRLAEMPDKRVAFQYHEGWLKNGFSISPLSLPLRNDVFIPNENSRDRFRGLFGVFADSLPDSWGELLLDKEMESLGIDRDKVSTLDRLAYVGKSGMGALEYYPAKESDFQVDYAGLDYDLIASECEKLLSSKETDQLDLLYKIGGSGGGTRPKILLSDKGKEWIVKFPAKEDTNISGKREYEYSLCAKKCGIIMTETELVPSSLCEGYFKTERFDRSNGEKIHTVTFAGLLEADFRAPSCDYDTFLKLVRHLTKDNKYDKEQMFRVMCFNVETHNLDDHTKNFSFLYKEDSGWRLAPAYDMTYSRTYFGEHTTSVNGKGINITDDDLIKVGEDAGLSPKICNQCINDIRENAKVLSRYIKDDKGRKRTKTGIEEKIREIQKETDTT